MEYWWNSTIFDLKMMVKSGQEKIIFEIHSSNSFYYIERRTLVQNYKFSKIQLFWEGHKNLTQSSSRFWHYLVTLKPWGRLQHIFVAFSEKLNFNKSALLCTWLDFRNCDVCMYDKRNFKTQVSLILHFDRVTEGWIQGI